MHIGADLTHWVNIADIALCIEWVTGKRAAKVAMNFSILYSTSSSPMNEASTFQMRGFFGRTYRPSWPPPPPLEEFASKLLVDNADDTIP